jgi:cytochrome c-type biogenesis protein CcmF
MIPEIGHLLLWLALGASLVLGVVPLRAAAQGRVAEMRLARPLSYLLFALVAASMACLFSAFATHDFSVEYVATHSNSALPLAYRLSALWGGHEGSLLLWLFMLTGWTLAVALRSAHLPLPVMARILAVMGWVAVGFLLFTLLTSNPFERLFPAAVDGRDLNPLLQDPGMIFHPPLLYMGYVGFSVAFAFAVAALIGGNLDATWARWTRPWTTAAWCFLTLGIALGSWWAYYELGWGGWWFWDPVENASLLPWLIGTALIHSLAVTEKRGSFKAWTVLLAIMAFALSLLGTFIVRSGVLSSVHAFATDPTRGLFMLIFLGIVVGVSLALYAWRAPTVGLGARFELISRESFLLANNVLLLVAMAAVMLGTLYPLVLDGLGLGKISVGPPYFDTVFVPLMAPLVFLMGVGPMARWKNAELPELWTRLKWALVVTVVCALATGWVYGHIGFMSSLGLAMAFWIAASVGADLIERLRPPRGMPGGSAWARARLLPRAMVGMMVAHLGVAVMVFGVTMVKTYDQERDVQMAPGSSADIAGYRFAFQGLREVTGANYRAIQGVFAVQDIASGKSLGEMRPEKRIYRVQRDVMTEAAINVGFSRDLYVSMGEAVDNGNAWIVRLQVKPFVDWIWGGCLLMALGGALALSDRRYRAKVTRSSEAPAGATAGNAAGTVA